MPQLESIKVIINQRSGLGEHEDVRERLLEILKTAGITADISIAQSGAEVKDLAHAAVRDGYDLVVAAGGDGTVSSVAAVVVDAGKTLGVLPLGTLNHFARDLGIPVDFEEAAQ